MKIKQENAFGENRVALIDDIGRPVFFDIQRDIILNVGDIVPAKVVQYHKTLHGYFLKTDKGEAFLPNAAPLSIGQTITVCVLREAHADKGATVQKTALAPCSAPDMAPEWAAKYHADIEQISVSEMDELIAEALEPHIQLSNGAELHIERSRIGWTIDVDSGTCSDDLDTVNQSVIPEIARQIRLKNMAGLILIDFAGSKRGKQRNAWHKALAEALATDKRASISGWTPAGLFEVQRIRTMAPLWDSCGNTPVNIYYRIVKKVAQCKSGRASVSAHPLVVDLLARYADIAAKPLFDTPLSTFEIKEK